MAGRGGGRRKTGQVRQYDRDTPLNNLFLSMCQRAGAKLDALGDSTGPLKGLG